MTRASSNKILVISLLRRTAAEFTAINPILKAGQEGYETDTRKRKVGDGETAWNDLQYDAAGSTDESNNNTVNYDGGRASEVYTLDQNITGGDVNGN